MRCRAVDARAHKTKTRSLSPELTSARLCQGLDSGRTRTKELKRRFFPLFVTAIAMPGRGISNLPAWMTSKDSVRLGSGGSGSQPPTNATSTPSLANAPAAEPIIVPAATPAAAPIAALIAASVAPSALPVAPPAMPTMTTFVPPPMMPRGHVPPHVMPPMIPRPSPLAAPIIPNATFPMPVPPRLVSAPPMIGGMSMQMPGMPMQMPGMPMQMPGMSMQMPGMSMQMPRPAIPYVNPMVGRGLSMPVSQPLPGVSVGDPNNEVSNWSEHTTPDGVKYWHNYITKLSVYDKPLVLKTPEERSIQPTKWKEYSAADGKKYYSDGAESLWEMPEEYRIWKEKMDSVEKKKAASESMGSNNIYRVDAIPEKVVEPILFATKEEALVAFKELLASKKVSAQANFKDVRDRCQGDGRWFSLESTGEKKQALAEYQSKKQKEDRELLKLKAKKARDAFLLMLAEKTEIDARTRWREAQEMLRNDARYKNVEDPIAREEIFKDFIVELEKKEREDKQMQRTTALSNLSKLIDDLHRGNADKIHRRSTWHDCKGMLLENVKGPEMRVLDEGDLRKCFAEFTNKLEVQYRDEEKRRRDEVLTKLKSKQDRFYDCLTGTLVSEGKLNPESRWRNVMPILEELPEYIDLHSFYESNRGTLVDSSLLGENKGRVDGPRDIFEVVLKDITEQYRVDKRLLKDILRDLKIEITHSMSSNDFNALIFTVAGVPRSSATTNYSHDSNNNCEKSSKDVAEVFVSCGSLKGILIAAEDGEEIEEDPLKAIQSFMTAKTITSSTNSLNVKEESLLQLRAMLTKRPSNANLIYQELHLVAFSNHEEENRRQRKREERYIELLQEYFYRSDHIGINWDSAKKMLDRHSAYENLGKNDRKRIFSVYMDQLNVKLEQKTKSMQNIIAANREQNNVSSAAITDLAPLTEPWQTLIEVPLSVPTIVGVEVFSAHSEPSLVEPSPQDLSAGRAKRSRPNSEVSVESKGTEESEKKNNNYV